ncbi:MAG: glutamate N-acetyltransferase / amino-acid acetyltransferase [Deltaproteobacteria bacterium]|nr:glutamate N-acetyltransferase / amino-acid acetyltransferase [Deltaproteobacteria bacterium]
MEIKRGEVTVPGFLASGLEAGIKEAGKKDLALLFSEVPAVAAGVFTKNVFKAAPVLLDIKRMRKGMAQAVIINSGNANAATGRDGYGDALEMARAVSRRMGIGEELVLVASTGVIGKRLPLEKVIGHVDKLVVSLKPSGIPDAEEAIMTTDSYPKMEYRKVSLGKRVVTICGIAKGAGMIEPHMATMLSFVLTDVAIRPDCLKALLKRAVDRSFNCISVDGCMSTNDTVIILANGQAGNRPLTKSSRDLPRFEGALTDCLEGLARSIVRDGEGATKVIEIVVKDARSENGARKVAYAIANSNLVKTAFYGKDPNWGRVISAIGAAGVPVPAESLELYFDDLLLFRRGSGADVDARRLESVMAQPQVKVTAKIGMGRKSARIFCSDLSFDYVRINAHYTT